MGKSVLNDVLNKNLSGMREFKPDLYEKCVEALTDSSTGRLVDTWQSDCVYVSESVNGEKILSVVNKDREYCLNSRYDAKAAVDIWMSQFEELNYKSIIIINGISNGMHIEAVSRIIGDDNRVLVFEPDIDIFMTLICNIDITEIIEDRRIAIFVNGLNLDTFRAGFRSVYTSDLAELIKMVEIPGYSRLYRDIIDDFIEKYCQKEIDVAYIERGTIEEYGAEMADNIINNMWDLCKASSIDILRDEIKASGVDLENVPAFIVSAGPSLDENVEQLKLAKGKAVIIAVDSAVSKLLKHDVEPTMIITVDSHKPMEIFKNTRFKNIPVIVCGQTRREVLVEHKGKVFAFSGDSFMYNFFLKEEKNVEGMETGGSVANNGFSLAEFLGFKTIILVGQDLAFIDNKKHTSEYFEENQIGDENDSDYAYVEGVDGGQLLTYANFKVYKEWFENRIVDNKSLKVINIVGGGAKINGTIQMSICEALDKYCGNDFDESIIYNAPYIFNDEQLDVVYEHIVKMTRQCDRIILQFNEGIGIYDKLRRLVKNKSTGTAEFRKYSQKADELTFLSKNEPILNLLSMYTKKEERELLEGLYQEDEGMEGAILVIDRSIKVLRLYQEALAKIKEKLLNVIEKEISKDVYEITEYSISFVD